MPRKELARVLSKRGIASRTLASQWIREGRVRVKGRVVRDPLFIVDINETDIRVDGEPMTTALHLYYMLNKPRGLVTTARDEQGRDTVYQCFAPPPPAWISPVGRLDKASEGLLLFTNDTDWANGLTDPASHLPKSYHVQVHPCPNEKLVEALLKGIVTGENKTLRCDDARILRLGEKNGWLEITLTEGKNRQIRRMLEALEFKVLRLIRVAIGPLRLGNLAKGAARELTPGEVARLSVRR
jgi:23S rRNA pseudouridine2605 synthase